MPSKDKAPAVKKPPAPAAAPAKKGPVRRANIVKSGNAGSSKPAAAAVAASDPDRPAPLFPVGYKTPLSLLYERCQKNGWEKPDVNTKKGAGSPESWTGSVTLKRKNAKTGGIDTVFMRPPPTGLMSVNKPTALEAKHWVAVYALFRFSNNLRLNLQLPPQTRDYWADLEKEKAESGPSKQWLFSTSPFEAAPPATGGANGGNASRDTPASSTVASASTTRSNTPAPSNGSLATAVGNWWRNAPEVRMPTALRDLVEETIRSMMGAFDVVDSEIDYGQIADKTAQLNDEQRAVLAEFASKGFRKGHVMSALGYVASCRTAAQDSDDPLVLSFATQSMRQAVLEYLFLHTPEEDLPTPFQAARPADAAARIATSRDSDQLAMRWRTERIAKETGFPLAVVERAMQDAHNDEALTIDMCVRRLALGPNDPLSAAQLLAEVIQNAHDLEDKELRTRQKDELEGLEGIFGSQFARISHGCEISIRHKRHRDIKVRFILKGHSRYPSESISSPARLAPTFFVIAPQLPTYIRLHMDALLIRRMNDDWLPVLEAGYGGVISEAVSYLTDIADDVIEHPPDARQVLTPLLGRSAAFDDDKSDDDEYVTKTKASRRPTRRRPATAADHAAARKHLQEMMQKKEYGAIRQVREALPAWKLRDQLVDMINANRVVIVSGETGSGKTTQVPSFVLDDLILRNLGGSANILVTQPRRVSAIGVATRVAYERLEDINGDSRKMIGYAIRGERKAGPDTKLLFCTTGVVLARLSRGGDADLSDVSHIFIDEVHERSVDSDFLLLELRDILKRNKKIKVILMSATINQKQFSDYFGGAPCIEIPGFTHPVQDHYLEDILPRLPNYQSSAKPAKKATQAQLDAMRSSFMERGVTDERTLVSLERLARSERIDYELVGATVAHCLHQSRGSEGGILVFMTGVAEINQSIEAIKRSVRPGERIEVFPLHANLSSAEQTAVFRPTKLGVRKVVVATNVAETSITIDGIVYVVDCGRVKENTFDPETSITKLVEGWTSKAASRQRRGRAGRTRPGQCYKLFTHWTEDHVMSAQPMPEIQRIPLEMLCLQIKAMRSHEDVKAYLSRALDPPDTKAVDVAWSTLVQLGAVYNGDMTSGLTPLGRHLSMLPVDLRLGKMLILACVFRCLDPVLTVVSMLSSKPFFVSPAEQRDAAKSARKSFYTSNSDILSDLKAFKACLDVRSKGNAALRSFAEDHFVSLSSFRDILSLRSEYIMALSDAGLLPFRASFSDERWNVNSDKENLLKAILYAGTRRLVTVKLPQATFDKGSSGAIERDREAKEVKFYEPDGRVFVHPSSLLFEETNYASRYVTYWNKHVTTKPFLRDANEVPMYGVLLFGPEISTDLERGGGLVILGANANTGTDAGTGGEAGGDRRIVMRAWPRTGVLISALRILFDRDLARRIEKPDWDRKESAVIKAMLSCIEKDGRL